MNISGIEIAISKYILNNEIVHYSDLEEEFQISKPTISKKLTDIDSFLNSSKVDIELIRGRNIGIYFTGNKKYLWELLSSNDEWHPITPKDRRMYILSSLLFRKNITTITNLTQELFVSQITIENDLLWIRKFIADNNGRLINDSGILKLVMTRDYLYAFMIYVFHDYWGDNINQSDDKNVIFPPILKNFFNENDARRIFQFVDNFLEEHNFKTTEYEYTSLVIYLLIQYTLFSNSVGIIKISNLDTEFENFEEETLELARAFNNKFHYHFKNEQKNYLNNFMILIKSENDRKLSFDNESEISEIKDIIVGHDKSVNIYDGKFLEGLSKHISLSVKRIKFGMKIINPYTSDFKKSYPISFDEALKLFARINKKFNVVFNDDEVALMGMYFASLSERRGVVNKMVTATIVCNTGIGTSRFLEEKIHQEMSDIIMVDGIKVTHELSSEEINSDIIISTVPIRNVNKPYVYVSPFLNQEDKNKILNLIKKINQTKKENDILSKLIDPRLIIFTEEKDSNYKSALLKLIEQTIKYGYSDDELYDSAIIREKLSSTATDGMALPHGTTNHIKKPFIGIIKSKQGIDWLGESVHIAFFMGLKGIDATSMKNIYHQLNNIVENKKIISNLINCDDKKKFFTYL
ncbi:BglG family transcription antiterminator [Companilactobacillus alimentarius]|uniref:BglG family transcription antiterminator n=1 Tax=Companilactobacillus alimentarius TaxID=1602 RepID=UPI0028B607BD|nr:PTS sugar transporter subunit IIA [Companilactobacillus alimentarius]MDT6951976.1 PTS sugar transporter subunit IIA [Companilactobacillus alimentarius]